MVNGNGTTQTARSRPRGPRPLKGASGRFAPIKSGGPGGPGPGRALARVQMIGLKQLKLESARTGDISNHIFSRANKRRSRSFFYFGEHRDKTTEQTKVLTLRV
jgi:hypothetical protein